jgi:Tol biopolymer transport system component
MYRRIILSLLVVAVALGAATASALPVSGDYSAWSPAVRVEATGAHPDFNGPSLDGCPFISRDDKTFYMASNRPGGLGGIDIWVSTRVSRRDPWRAPVNVGAPVNSTANDFCPTISRDGHLFYFVSNRTGGCGGDDIYTTRMRPDGWDPIENLGCSVNSTANEASPFPLPEAGSGPVLYYSSNRAGGYTPEPPGVETGDSDLYVSESHGGEFGAGQLVPGANSAAEDGQPNVRRDGLELFFFSTRPGTLGMADIYSATRTSTSDPWSTPVNLGPNVNAANGAETRPSLSWDGTVLYFGSSRPGGEGSTDHYVTTREPVGG